MTDPFESDKKRELILSEHWMSTGIRPVSEKVLLPIVNRAPGTNDRHQEEAETHELRLDAMGATSKNANGKGCNGGLVPRLRYTPYR